MMCFKAKAFMARHGRAVMLSAMTAAMAGLFCGCGGGERVFNPWSLLFLVVGGVAAALAAIGTRNYRRYRARKRAQKARRRDIKPMHPFIYAMYAVALVMLVLFFALLTKKAPSSPSANEPLGGDVTASTAAKDQDGKDTPEQAAFSPAKTADSDPAKWGIRCNFGGSVDILRTDEVLTLRAILRTIDNPLQDIPLVAALMSPAFGFTADDIAAIRADRKGGSIYNALKKSENEKATAFLTTLNILRRESRLKDLSALLQAVFAYTKLDSIYAAMPDGEVRVENLQAFCQLVGGFEASGAKSLSRFLRHLEALDEKGVPGTAEQNAAGAVTIMSIHKSKGLEFPVVFLSGLARSFNRDSLRQQVLCHKELGLGLSCVDTRNRVRYPSIAKRAIMSKLLRESISEELRVLYVAMTRPKDRLIMTYAFRNAENELSQLTMRMDLSDPMLLTGDVDCPGQWVLYSALHRGEAGAFFACGGYPGCSAATEKPWLITLCDPPEAVTTSSETREEAVQPIDVQVLEKLKIANGFRYPHQGATVTPSKQTATQIKGRQKDKEAAQDAKEPPHIHRSWRKPAFIRKTVSGRDYGNALHAVMQYIDFARCDREAGIASEISRLTEEGYISSEQASLVEPSVILGFFSTQMGQKLRVAPNVIREFKFSILDDGAKYGDGVTDDSVLLQGVVDCAIIAPDGIEIIDFKTDRVTEETLRSVAQGYRMQVMTYADALSRIYGLPVKQTRLYFFSIGQFVDM